MEITIQDFRIQNIDYRQLEPFQGNLKDLTESNYDRLKKSFTEKGLFVPLFVWENQGHFKILDGHGRERLFSKEGAQFLTKDGTKTHEVPCLIVQANNLKDAKEKLLIISSQFQSITQEGFDEFTAHLDADWLKDTTHFDALFSNSFEENSKHFLSDEETVPEPPKEPITHLGDLWTLGNHRLLCGDATQVDNVNRLINDTKPILMVTDPPYGVNYDPEWREEWDGGFGKRNNGKVLNDDKMNWTEAYSLFQGDICYVWHASNYTHFVASHLQTSSFEIINQIIWAKQHFVLSRGDYHWQHEPCWYAVRKGKKHNWQGARDQSTVWSIKNNNSIGNNDKEETWGHGTQKPLECMERPILNNSSAQDFIYDPFGGSGTTLIACEKNNRLCLMMELNPTYCDVIVKRWENFTGQKAQLIK